MDEKKICQALKDIPPGDQFRAKLFQGDHLLSNGLARIEEERGYGVFWPSSQTPPDIPKLPLTLELTDVGISIPIDSLHQCTGTWTLHYHFLLSFVS